MEKYIIIILCLIIIYLLCFNNNIEKADNTSSDKLNSDLIDSIKNLGQLAKDIQKPTGLTLPASLVVTNNIDVSGNSNFSGNTNIRGNIDINGTIKCNNISSIKDNLMINNNIDISGVITTVIPLPKTNNNTVATTSFVQSENNIVAFVTFNGSTGAIISQKNVNKIDIVNTGEYKINFTKPFDDTNYCVLGSCTFAISWNRVAAVTTVTYNKESILIWAACARGAPDGQPFNPQVVNVIIVK